MSVPHSDRNLLFGLLALYTGFVSREDLIAAVGVWLEDKSKQLAEILRARNSLANDERDLLSALVQKHLARHGDSVEQSLATLSGLELVSADLHSFGDADIEATLSMVSRGQSAVKDAEGALEVGRRVGEWQRYRVLRPHAKGGLGEVFLAQDLELHREVALKEIQLPYAHDPDSRARFVLEAEITGGLEHPGIVPVYGLGQYGDGRPFYAMRFIKGNSLKEATDRFHGKVGATQPNVHAPGAVSNTNATFDSLEFRKLLGRFVDVCEAIEYAHSRGVLHRDLKPGNIMLGKYGETLVVDWGLAKVQGRGEDAVASSEVTLRPASTSGSSATRYGSAIGTPAYMSPEQAEGRLDLLGPASDVYSLGSTLYCVLTGESPFGKDDVAETLRKVKLGEFPNPRAICAKIPRPLEKICLKAMAVLQSDRYSSAAALADDVEKYLADEPVSAWPEPVMVKIRRWVGRHRVIVTSAAAVVVMALVALAISTAVVSRAHRATAEALVATQRQRHAAQELSATFALDRGLTLASQGDPRRGLLWFARSLELAPDDAHDLQSLARANLQEWGREVVPLSGYFHHPRAQFGNTVTNVAISPDGRLAATGVGSTVRLWDMQTGKQVGEPLHHGEHFWQVRFSPDGTRLLTGGYINTSWRLWDVAQRQPIGEPLKQSRGSEQALFSPDSQHLLTISREGGALLWDARDGALRHDLRDKVVVLAADFSPDGRVLCAACKDRTVRLFDIASGQPVGESLPHEATVHAVTFHPNGRLLFTASADSHVHVWDIPTRQPSGQPWKHPAAVQQIGMSRDGDLTYTVAADNRIRFWNSTTGQLLGTTPAHSDRLRHVRISADGRTLVSSEFGTLGVKVRFWDTQTGLPAGQPLEGPEGVWDLAVAPDSRSILVGTDDGRLWSLPRHRSLLSPLRHQGPVTIAIFSPDGKSLLTAGEDGLAQLWDATTGKPLAEALLHQGIVSAAAFAPNGKTLFTLAKRDTSWRPHGGTGEVRLWDTATGKPATGPLTERLLLSEDGRAPLGPITTVSFSSDGSRLFAGTGPSARVWDTTTGISLGMLRHGDVPAPMALRPDGKAVLVAQGLKLQLIDPTTDKPLSAVMKHDGNGPLLAVAISRNGKVLATSAADYSARLWDANTGRPLAVLPHPEWVVALAFSPDDKTLATGTDIELTSLGRRYSRGEARLWDVASGKPIGKSLPHNGGVVALAFSPDRTQLLTGSRDHTARLWNVESGEPLGKPLSHNRDVVSVAFSADGKIAGTASSDGTARLWDAATCEARGEPLQHQGEVLAILFSSEGNLLATASADRRAQLWDVATGKPIGAPMVHPHDVLSLDFSPDGKILATGCGKTTGALSGGFTWSEIRAWDPGTGQPSRSPQLSPFYLDNQLIISPDGNSFLTSYSGGGSLRRWELDTGKLAASTITNDAFYISNAQFSPDGKTILVIGSLSTAKGWRAAAQLWDAASGKARSDVILHTEESEITPGIQSFITAAAFRPDGKTFLTVAGKVVRIWETAAGLPLGEPFKHYVDFTGAKFSPDGRLVLFLCIDNSARLWEPTTSKFVGPPLQHHQRVMAMAFSPDGRLVATGGGTLYDSLENKLEGFVQFWDVATARPIGGPLLHSNGVTSVCFGPDGKRILSAARDGTARLWDVPGRLGGTPTEIKHWAQCLSGMELDSFDAFVPVPEATTLMRRQELEAAKEPALP